MKLGAEPSDCPLCASAGAVYGGFCQVCLANVEGIPPQVLELPTPSIDPLEAPERTTEPVRFSQVVEELRTIAVLAAVAGTGTGPVGEACRRAEDLLERLRAQFLSEVVFGTEQPASVA